MVRVEGHIPVERGERTRKLWRDPEGVVHWIGGGKYNSPSNLLQPASPILDIYESTPTSLLQGIRVRLSSAGDPPRTLSPCVYSMLMHACIYVTVAPLLSRRVFCKTWVIFTCVPHYLHPTFISICFFFLQGFLFYYYSLHICFLYSLYLSHLNRGYSSVSSPSIERLNTNKDEGNPID